MSLILGNNLRRLNVESLEIIDPVLSNIDDSVFEALYEAISVSKVKNLKLGRIYIKDIQGKRGLLSEVTLPHHGIIKLAESDLKSFEICYWDINNFSLPSILQALPRNLMSLKVYSIVVNYKLSLANRKRNERGIFRTIFTHLPNLESLAITDVILADQLDDFQFLAGAIRSGKLKNLEFINSPIPDVDVFRLICEALLNSKIEILSLDSSDYDQYQTPINALIEVLPSVHFLKILNLRGQGRNNLDIDRLISNLEFSKIEYLGLASVRLNNSQALKLAQIIPVTKLKALDIRDNLMLSPTGMDALRNAINAKHGSKLWA